jgi:hypothetical protein
MGLRPKAAWTNLVGLALGVIGPGVSLPVRRKQRQHGNDEGNDGAPSVATKMVFHWLLLTEHIEIKNLIASLYFTARAQ